MNYRRFGRTNCNFFDTAWGYGAGHSCPPNCTPSCAPIAGIASRPNGPSSQGESYGSPRSFADQ